MFDGEAFGQEMVEIFKGAIDRATAPLLARIEELEKRAGDAEAGFADALIDSEGHLVLVGGDGRTKTLGVVVGKDGDPGPAGRDGLSAEDVDLTVLEDGRTLEFSLTQGDTQYAFELAFPVPLYCGVYREGAEHQKGDMVTWGGSLWHCDKDTTQKPGTEDWTLAVKKGRDAK
ncbi:hypothetical protein NCF86_00235 [Pelagerythrobacter marinus]|nr:hypothetical protein NCF86_00235 [Pelagerythrobacter marinus]